MSSFGVENTVDFFDYLSDSDEAWDGLVESIGEDCDDTNDLPNHKRSLETDDNSSSSDKVTSPITNTSGDEEDLSEDPQLLQQRFQVITQFVESLNLCDNDKIEQIIKDSCSPDMILRLPRLNVTHSGSYALLVLWLICHEVFPDGIFKVLERREVKMTQPRGRKVAMKQFRPMIEVIYRFTGSRIINEPPALALGTFLSLHKDISKLSIAEVTKLVLQFIPDGKHMAAAANTLSPAVNSAITELVVQFEPGTAKTVDWAFTILANDGF